MRADPRRSAACIRMDASVIEREPGQKTIRSKTKTPVPSPLCNKSSVLSTLPGGGRSRRGVKFGRADAPEPALAPVRVDAPRTHAMEVTGTDEAVDDDAVRLDVDHLSGLLVDDVLDAAEHAAAPAAVAEHLAVEAEAARVVTFVERVEDLVFRLDLDHVSGLQVQPFRGVRPACPSVEERVLAAAVEQRVARQQARVQQLQHVEEAD